MAFRRGGHVGQRVAKKIDFKQWANIPAVGLSISTSGTNIGGSLVFLVPATILRFRGRLQMQFDATQQAGDEMVLTFGLGVISSDAFDAGGGSVPDPAGEPEYPWLWWGAFHLHSELTLGQNQWGTNNQVVDVDSKAMRKIKPGQSLAWVVQSVAITGAPETLIDFLQARVLIGT